MNSNKQLINSDYLVIGAGAGGLLVAVGLLKLGKDVVVISENIGGDCTHYGCVPSKTLLYLAKQYRNTHSKEDKNKLRTRAFKSVQATIASFVTEEKKSLPKNRYFPGRAWFISSDTVEVSHKKNQHYIRFRKKCIIATGSRPVKIKIAGISTNKIITNEELFYLDKFPSSITIFGGGPIGAEMATACTSFGVTTHLVSRSYLSKEPKEIAKKSLKQLENLGVKYVSARPKNLLNGKLYLDNGTTLPETELYLSATGRAANTELNLEAAGINYDQKGIVTNNELITANKNVFAIGDVGQNPQFTHLAASHGKFVLKKLMLPIVKREKRAIPRVTFTSPAIASVGSLEVTNASKIFALDFAASDTGRTRFDTDSFGLVAVDTNTGNFLGASLYGDFSADLINLFTLLIDERIPATRLAEFITPYPTYANVLHKFSLEYLQFLSTSFKKNPLKTLWLLKKYIF